MTSNNLLEDCSLRINWPKEPVEEICFIASQHDLFDAAKFISIIAYPSDLKENGKAHRCARALLAHAFRRARHINKIEKLPAWVGEISTQQMNNSIRSAYKRMRYRAAAYLTIVDAEIKLIDKENLKLGISSGMTVRFSGDFEEVTFTFAENTQPPIPDTWASARRTASKGGEAKNRQSNAVRFGGEGASLRAAIIAHRGAFQKSDYSSNDRDLIDQQYRHILERYVRPMFPIFHLYSAFHESFLKNKEKIETQRRNPYDYMLMNPDWISGVLKRAEMTTSFTTMRLLRLGVPICSCRCVRFASASQS